METSQTLTTPCGCYLAISRRGYPGITYCPLHAAAPELLELLKTCYDHAQKYGAVPRSADLLWRKVKYALAKATEVKTND